MLDETIIMILVHFLKVDSVFTPTVEKLQIFEENTEPVSYFTLILEVGYTQRCTEILVGSLGG